MNIKSALLNQCIDYVTTRLQNVEAIIASNKKALESETKSSVGDKHETGRAMLQLEMEKAGKQLTDIAKMKEIVAKIDIKKSSTIAHLGSIVYCTNANYFLAISYGQLTLENKQFFVISTSSPIGKLLLGKQKGDSFSFNGSFIEINKVE